jgi:hypothetical protein
MPPKETKSPFTMAARKLPQNIRDKDNAQPRIVPPQQVRTPHPQLAPPGMSGIRTSQRMGLPHVPPKPKRMEFEAGVTKREFKSLAPKSPSKAHERWQEP